MIFDPRNPIVQRCIQAMSLEAQNKPAEALKLFESAWQEATHPVERFITAHYLANYQTNPVDKLRWLATMLENANEINDASVQPALPLIHHKIAECYDALGQPTMATQHHHAAETMPSQPTDPGPFYHGTKAQLNIGDTLNPGGLSNYQTDLVMNHIYFTAHLNGAGLAASLAQGDGPERVYVIEPTGEYEHDPNVTNLKFPGNPTRSYRSLFPLLIVGIIDDWAKQTTSEINQWKERLKKQNGKIIN